MGCNSWMGYVVILTDEEYREAIEKWANGTSCYKVSDGNGNFNYGFDMEDAGYFDDALGRLRERLAAIPVPVGAWACSARYEYYDAPNEDGSFSEFDIIEGKMTNCKESRIVMVDCEPWCDFDMTEVKE